MQLAPIDDSRAVRCRFARERFEALGIKIGDWADQRGYKRELVYGVLAGRIEGKRGIAHRIAVDLGIKPAPDTNDALNRCLIDGKSIAGLTDGREEHPMT
jgi:gp16 family phage-associated protein